ncbi:MAG: hypothetical protein IPJ81_04465 [Chitinophagaceae bacterium]|nr:hypothetical protein [Chitinophagaceae bacterium]
MTVADIDQAYINATDPAPQFTESVNDGQMLTFQTAAGNRGIIRILEFDAVAKTAKIDVRFVK